MATQPDAAQWYTLIQQSFRRDGAETLRLTDVALHVLAAGGSADDALAAARTASHQGYPVGPPTSPYPWPAPAAPPAGTASELPPPGASPPGAAAPYPQWSPGAPSGPAGNAVPWYHTPGGIFLIALVFLPAGLYLLWTSPVVERPTKMATTAVLAVLWVAGLVLFVHLFDNLHSATITQIGG